MDGEDEEVIIRLEPHHDAFAVKVAHRRQQNAIDEHRTPGNNLVPDDEHDLIISINGTRAEAAAKLYLNPVKWNAFKTGRLDDTADLEDWIDVKGIMLSSHRMILKPNSKEHWAYFLVDGSEHPDYRMLCWCWGHEGMQEQYWEDPTGMNRPAWFVPQSASFMRGPPDLFALVRQRQFMDEDDDWVDLLARANESSEPVMAAAGPPVSLPLPVHEPFIHNCHCGLWGPFGFGVDLRAGKTGTWYCREHRPSR